MFEIIQINNVYIFFFLFFSGYSFYMYVKQLLDLRNEDELFLLENSNIKTTQNLPITKYEDKYLEKYNNFTSNLELKEDDLKNKENKYNELLALFEKTKEMSLQDIKNDLNELIMLELSIDHSNEDTSMGDFEILQNKYLQLKENKPDTDQIEKESYEYMCELYYDKLKNNFLFENTPNGNIVMCYNNEKKSFEYYSDKMMPYRYLETVARKYVTTFYCKPLYVDMMNEVKNAENKLIEETKQIEEIKKIKEMEKNKDPKVKDVFAKLKSYNTEKPTVYPSRNNRNMKPIPNYLKSKILSIQNKSNESHVLKENANRYTHNGKFVNFSILKKVDKQKIDKNYDLSYKDYMQMVKNLKLK